MKIVSFPQNHEDFELKKLLFDMILSLSRDPAFIAVRFLSNFNFLLQTRLLYPSWVRLQLYYAIRGEYLTVWYLQWGGAIATVEMHCLPDQFQTKIFLLKHKDNCTRTFKYFFMWSCVN